MRFSTEPSSCSAFRLVADCSGCSSLGCSHEEADSCKSAHRKSEQKDRTERSIVDGEDLQIKPQGEHGRDSRTFKDRFATAKPSSLRCDGLDRDPFESRNQPTRKGVSD